MKLHVSAGILCLIVISMSVAGTHPANATLGENFSSVSKDRRALSAAKGTTTDHINYQVQAMITDAAEVREYVAPSGIVFAVAWNGLAPPDLTTLLGSYHRQYQAAKEQTVRRHGRKGMHVQTDDVVVETWGHMRNLQGRAYVPSLVPTGVDLNEIR